MALVVETGAGLSDAESYLSVAAAGVILAGRGDAGWATGSDAAREAALRRATSAVDARFRLRYTGWRRYQRSQALDWPRAGAFVIDGGQCWPVPFDEVPMELQRAVAVAASIELAEPGALTPTIDRDAALRRFKAGSVEIEYAADAPVVTVYTVIETMIAGLLEPSSPYTARAERC